MDAASFWSRLKKGNGPNDCWFLLINEKRRGYQTYLNHRFATTVRYNGKGINCYKLAYQLIYGEVPKGMLIRHRCGNGGCCNPDHLILGTTYQNRLDWMARLRAGIPNGELATYEDLPIFVADRPLPS